MTTTTAHDTCLLCGGVDKRRIIGTLRAAILYLEHPEVREIPFAIGSATQAERCRRLIRDLGGATDER